MKLAVIAGDGIGPEVIGEAVGVLEAVVPEVSTTEYDLGARRYHRNGELLTDDDLASLRSHDAILLGAIGDPSVPSGVLERGLLLTMRFALDHLSRSGDQSGRCVAPHCACHFHSLLHTGTMMYLGTIPHLASGSGSGNVP